MGGIQFFFWVLMVPKGPTSLINMKILTLGCYWDIVYPYIFPTKFPSGCHSLKKAVLWRAAQVLLVYYRIPSYIGYNGYSCIPQYHWKIGKK